MVHCGCKTRPRNAPGHPGSAVLQTALLRWTSQGNSARWGKTPSVPYAYPACRCMRSVEPAKIAGVRAALVRASSSWEARCGEGWRQPDVDLGGEAGYGASEHLEVLLGKEIVGRRNLALLVWPGPGVRLQFGRVRFASQLACPVLHDLMAKLGAERRRVLDLRHCPKNVGFQGSGRCHMFWQRLRRSHIPLTRPGVAHSCGQGASDRRR